VKNARKLDRISYDEMLELASLGALVLQPRAVECAKIYQVPLHVRSSFNHNPGTIVEEGGTMEKEIVVSGVAHDLNVCQITIFDVPDRPGIASRLFTSLAEEHINVDMIVQSSMRHDVNDISFTVGIDDEDKAMAVVNKVAQEIEASGVRVDEEVAKVSIVGAGMISNPGVAARMFAALAQEKVNIHMISTSEIKVSCIIDTKDVERAVNSIHQEFRLDIEG
jgi:aspartate kinase